MLQTLPPQKSLEIPTRPVEEAYHIGEREYLLEELPALLTFVITDVVSVVGSTLLAYSLISSLAPEMLIDIGRIIPLIAISTVCSFALLGLYPGFGIHSVVELRRMCLGTSIVFALIFFSSIFATQAIGPGVTLLSTMGWLFALVASPLCRLSVRQFFSRFTWWSRPVLIFGAGRNGVSIYHFLIAHRRLGLRPLGVIGDEYPAEEADGFYLCSFADAKRLIHKHRVKNVIVAMQDCAPADLMKVVEKHAARVPHCLVVPDMKGLPSLWSYASDCGGMPGFQCKDQLQLVNGQILKLVTDYSLALIVSILVAPLFAVLCLLIKLTSRGPVFYKQERMGRKGRIFHVWKFRTMAPNADKLLADLLANDPVARCEWETNLKLKVDPRITWIGRILRTTSLDELPQLFNVLKGEMSLVGPRPILIEEVSRYGECLELYKRVRPGITGMWQVSGRNDTSYDERLRLVAFYVRNWSPWLDLHILAATVQVVLFRRGAR
jgi:Undecaprenyl-phosphate galactose phosphotransferase WbaP